MRYIVHASWSRPEAQVIPLSRKAGRSCTCPDGNRPPFLKNTFTPSSNTAAAMKSMARNITMMLFIMVSFLWCKCSNLHLIFGYLIVNFNP